MSAWAFDGLEGTPVTEDGFGDSCNDAATSMTLFCDHLFRGRAQPDGRPRALAVSGRPAPGACRCRSGGQRCFRCRRERLLLSAQFALTARDLQVRGDVRGDSDALVWHLEVSARAAPPRPQPYASSPSSLRMWSNEKRSSSGTRASWPSISLTRRSTPTFPLFVRTASLGVSPPRAGRGISSQPA